MPVKAAISYRGVATAENAAGSTTLSIGMPSGTVTDDVMIAIVATRSGTGSITPPSGWTLINTTNSSTTIMSSTYYKVAGSSEAGPYDFTITSSKAAGAITSYSGVDTADPVNIAGAQANTASTIMSAPAVVTTVANTMLVGAYSQASSAAFSTGSGMTFRNYATSSGGGSTGSKITAGIQDVANSVTGNTGGKTMTSSVSIVSTGHLIALNPAPVVSQASYRFFQNTDSTTASTPYAAAGTPAVIASSTPFRLRLNIGNASGGSTMTSSATRQFILQYALRGSDNVCDASFTNESYANVTSSTPVQFYNNPTPVDGASYVTNANDPSRSGITAIGQKYTESNPMNMGASVLANQDGLWDIPLTTSGVSEGQVYCLRTLSSNTVNISNMNGGYSSIAQFSIPAPVVSQANYRWFSNADSTTPGMPLVPQDTSATVSYQTPVRLRERYAVDSSDLATSSANYKIQYAEKVGTCDTSFAGETYSDLYNPTILNQFLDAGTVVEDTSYGSRPWSSPNSAAVLDGGSASAGSKSTTGTPTTYLLSSNHGFTVPLNATITGVDILGTFGAQIPVMPGFGVVNDSSIRIVKNGVISGNNMANGGGWSGNGWFGTLAQWGVPLTPNDVNSANFGVAMAALITGDNLNVTTATADNIKIRVNYTLPTSAPVEYFDNPTPANAGIIVSSGSDPINGARPTVYQQYQELDPFNNPSSISPGSDGVWDFSITPHAGAIGKTYCFRTVKSGGSLLDTYAQIPELTVTAGGPTIDQQLRGGQSVLNGVKTPATW
jgi:hypothetical protein